MYLSLLTATTFALSWGVCGTDGLARPWFVNIIRSNNVGRPEDVGRSEAQSSRGRVTRLAVRSFHPVHSKPSSNEYTTRKEARESIIAHRNGAAGDYNHYRKVALGNTPDRAISILTTDTLKYLKAHNFPVQAGDLGENILVDGLKFADFEPGQIFLIGQGDTSVILQVTEPMIACANLCKLPYINEDSLQPRERISKCSQMVKALNIEPGLRGWYAKVLREGAISLNAEVIEMRTS